MGTCLYIRRIRSGLPFWERRRRAIVRESCCRQGYASVLETQQEMRRLRGVLSAPSVHSKEPLCRGMSSEGAKENAEMVRRPAGGVEYRKGQGGAECEIWQRGSVYLGRTGLALEKYNFFPPPISTRSPRCLSPLPRRPRPSRHRPPRPSTPKSRPSYSRHSSTCSLCRSHQCFSRQRPPTCTDPLTLAIPQHRSSSVRRTPQACSPSPSPSSSLHGRSSTRSSTLGLPSSRRRANLNARPSRRLLRPTPSRTTRSHPNPSNALRLSQTKL